MNATYAQTASITSGCVPLTVDFTAPAGHSTYYWDFKDGASSVLANPTNVFITAGTYVVEFKESSTGPIVGTVTINVYPKPDPEIITDPTPAVGCKPFNVTFTANPNAPPGVSITGFNWTFGDGLSGTGSPVSHIYTSTGYYSVAVEVTSSMPSCNATKLIDSLVVVSGFNGSANISPNPAVSCDTPFTVTPTNTLSSFFPIVSYSWDFGDGTTSSARNPGPHTYSGSGSFHIHMTATDSIGCTYNLDRDVSITPLEIDIDMPDTISTCGAYTFSYPYSSTGVYFLWNAPGSEVGDGTSAADTLSVAYSTTGTYSITLYISMGSCVKSLTRNVVVYVPPLIYDIDPDTVCSDPQIIHLSTDPSYYVGALWITESDMDTICRSIDSTFLYYRDMDSTQWYENDTMSIYLTDKYGCDHFIRDAFYYSTIALVTPDVHSGCAPLNVNFENISISTSPTASWGIDYGDGTSASFLPPTMTCSHVYNSPGTYFVRLWMNSVSTCVDTSYYIQIDVGTAPVSDFSIDKPVICHDEPLTITNLTATADSSERWHYWSDNFTLNACFYEMDGVFMFNDAVGPQTITLQSGYNDCFSEVSKNVIVKGPNAKFTAVVYCDSAWVVTVRNEAEEATSVYYDMGDGTTYTSPNFVHHYTADGTYTITQIAYNDTNTCNPDTFRREVLMYEPHAVLSVGDSNRCPNSLLDISAEGSTGFINDGCYRPFIWFFDYPYSTPDASTNWLFPVGSNDLMLIVSNPNGCTDTARLNINLEAPTLSLNPNLPDSVCKPSYDIPIWGNISYSHEIDSAYYIILVSDTLYDSTFASFTYPFGDTLYFDFDTVNNKNYLYNWVVYLVATDTFGCTTVLADTVHEYFHEHRIAIYDRQVCIGETVSFENTILSNNGFNTINTWDLGDGTLITQDDVMHAYSGSGTYPITYTYTDSLNNYCHLEIHDSVNVNPTPDIDIFSTADTTSVYCFPLSIDAWTISLTPLPSSNSVWTLNGTTNFNLDTIAITFNRGINTLKVVVSTPAGCTDTAQRIFEVIGPEGDFITDTNNICKGEDIQFTLIDTNDVYTYQWDFGDGTTQSDSSPISHTYTYVPLGGSTVAKLTVFADGLLCPYSIEKPINIHEVLADFERNHGDTAICYSPFYALDNLSLGADNYHWDFGDGTTSGTEEPGTHTYPGPGTYMVTLNIENILFGCKDTLALPVILYPYPTVQGVGDTICLGDTATLTVEDSVPANKYVWSPSEWVEPDTSSTTYTWVTQSQQYIVVVVDSNGCKDTSNAMVVVIPPPNEINFDTTVDLGAQVILPFEQQVGYIYVWSPDTGLSCFDCDYPETNQLFDTIIYNVHFTDVEHGCFEGNSVYIINVRPETLLELPNTFTPNGDGINDIVYVKGWGIKELNFFRIYNRWGELVFETNDKNVGWDGRYKGELQNDDIYIFKAVGTDYYDRELVKEGYLHLMH